MDLEGEMGKVMKRVAGLVDGKVKGLRGAVLKEVGRRISEGDGKGALDLLIAWADFLFYSPSFWKAGSMISEEGETREAYEKVMEVLGGMKVRTAVALEALRAAASFLLVFSTLEEAERSGELPKGSLKFLKDYLRGLGDGYRKG